MTNRSSYKLENIGHGYHFAVTTLLLALGFLTPVVALANLYAPSVQK